VATAEGGVAGDGAGRDGEAGIGGPLVTACWLCGCACRLPWFGCAGRAFMLRAWNGTTGGTREGEAGSRGLVEGRDILGPRVGHVGADVPGPPAPAWMLMFW
jgi:hypothetical protein